MNRSSDYETSIGLEVHVQLATKSKIFCGCSTKFGAPPNTQVCPVCLGFPGALPVMNREILRLAVKAALALKCEIAGMMKFDRKNYFYPDLPKNFQISQYDRPLAVNGALEIPSSRGAKAIRIKRVHLEEDAGKLIHENVRDASLIDFNRSGMPLLEIVSEPDIASPGEAYEYLTALKHILEYLGVSDCNMEEGSLRCDANVSVRKKGKKTLGVKTELKNMNTFKGIRSALQYELERQTGTLKEGGVVVQETRLWNEAEGRTRPMRAKEEAFDYRYFPEPDLPPFLLDRVLVEEIKKGLPELPKERLGRFERDYGLLKNTAALLTADKDIADYFEECRAHYANAHLLANWITGDIQSELNRRGVSIKELGLKAEYVADMMRLIDEGAITGKIAKAVLPEMIDTKLSAREIIESKGLSPMKDAGELSAVIEDVIKNNPKPAKDYKDGKAAAIVFLVGLAMKATKGRGNPEAVKRLLKEKLDAL